MSDESNYQRFCTSSNETELRDRIAEVISKATTAWIKDEYVTDLSEGDYIAQAIIDDLGLHYVDSEEYAKVGLDWLEVEKGRHVVGRWEKQ